MGTASSRACPRSCYGSSPSGRTRLTWLELRTENPAALLQAALDAGLTQVRHPGHPYYFMAPGGQVFTIAPQT